MLQLSTSATCTQVEYHVAKSETIGRAGASKELKNNFDTVYSFVYTPEGPLDPAQTAPLIAGEPQPLPPALLHMLAKAICLSECHLLAI